MSYLTAIVMARHELLKNNEEPKDILISVNLKHAIWHEVTPYFDHRLALQGEQLMGMNVEWTKPRPLTQPQISIRTKRGDMRIVNYCDDAPQPQPPSRKEE